MKMMNFGICLQCILHAAACMLVASASELVMHKLASELMLYLVLVDVVWVPTLSTSILRQLPRLHQVPYFDQTTITLRDTVQVEFVVYVCRQYVP